MKRKQIKENDLSSMLPLKMLLLSYLNNHHYEQTMNDCHNAISSRIQKLHALISQNYTQISEIVSNQNDKSKQDFNQQKFGPMQIIEEEDYNGTERSMQAQSERKRNNLVRKFNQSIGLIQKSASKFEQVMFMYKNEIKEIAKDLTIQKQLNKKLTKQLSQKTVAFMKQSNKQMIQKNPLSSKQSKDSRSNSLSRLGGNKANLIPSFSKPPSSMINQQKRPLKGSKNSFREQDEDEVRAPPKPFCEECVNRQKELQVKEKQSLEEKNKWKELSSKITHLKDQLSSYEEQLINKQTQINKLNEQLKKKSTEDAKNQTQQKKKLRSMNTTLRGEKIVLENQLMSLRKKAEESQQLILSLQTQNKKLKMQKENLESTIKWHTNTIEDLRANFSSSIKEDSDLAKKFKEEQANNQLLYEQILNQEKYLEEFNQKLIQVEQANKENIKKLNSKIQELEGIIDEKNQTIVRMKMNRDQNCSYMGNLQPSKEFNQSKRQAYGTILNKTIKRQANGSNGAQSNLHTSSQSGFQQNMVRVLNKKLVEKDLLIQKLQKENLTLKQEMQYWKQPELLR